MSQEANAPAMTVDEYIARASPEARPALEQLRAAIRAVVPQATEAINYQMPTFRLGTGLVSYAAWKNHIGMYALSSTLLGEFAEEVKPYATAKGTLQFPLDAPMPIELVQRLVRAKLAERERELANKAAATAAKKEKSK